MFKKLSSAFVAISLVAVAQPALAKRACFTVNSITPKAIYGGPQNFEWEFWPSDKPAPDWMHSEVSVNGKEADKTQVKVGMYCDVKASENGGIVYANANGGTIAIATCASGAPAVTQCSIEIKAAKQNARDQKEVDDIANNMPMSGGGYGGFRLPKGW